MPSDTPTADTSRRLLRPDSYTGQPHTTCGSRPAAGSSVLPLGGDRSSQHQPTVTQGTAEYDNQLTDLTIHSDDEDNEEAEPWTQIPGPSDEDMSDSEDDSTFGTAVQYQIPIAVQQAERNTTSQSSDLHTVPEIHGRYKGFVRELCKATATEGAEQHVLEGLPIAIATVRSIWLDEDSVHTPELDIYAFAFVIHVWQIVCTRMQHGKFPPEEMEQSVCLTWTAYLLSAHAIVTGSRKVSLEELRYAVQYWEDSLRSMGGGNKWMEDRWAKYIPQIDQEAVIHRNETADRYLEALEKYGKEGLVLAIIAEEKNDECTQIRTMIQKSPEGMKVARRQMASMLYSMDTSLLKALIQGQLPRLAEVESGTVYQALQRINNKDYIQPGTYMNCICDYAGLSPTPEQWRRVCEQMLKYVQYNDEHNDLAERIDQQLHPKVEWPKDLAHKGLRRYTEWRSYTENGSNIPDGIHRQWVKYFVDQLKMRIADLPIHAPLSVPVVEVGFSNDPSKRLRQHRHHESSNYLMNLAEAVFAMEYPNCFQLQQRVVFACYRSIQTWLSEIVVTQLAQGYVQGGGGFSHEPAGRSNTSSNKTVPTKTWSMFEAQIYADGSFETEARANHQRLLATEQASEQTREWREQEEQSRRRVHNARVTHLRNLIAVQEARKNLFDHLRRRQS